MTNETQAITPSAQPADASLAAAGGPVPAGSPEIPAILAQILSELNQEREIAVAINNYTQASLEHPIHYLHVGKIEIEPPAIGAGQADFVAAVCTTDTNTGTGGLVEYRLQGTPDRVVILWFVPADYSKYNNRFGFRVVRASAAIDEDLYQSMYGESTEAEKGGLTVTQDGYTITGTMGTGGQADMNVSFKTAG